MHNTCGELPDGGEPPFTGSRLLQGKDFSRALLNHLFESFSFRRHAVIELRRAPRLLLELPGELRLHRHITLDGDGTANLSVLVVERVGVHLNDDLPAIGTSLHRERFATDAFTT